MKKTTNVPRQGKKERDFFLLFMWSKSLWWSKAVISQDCTRKIWTPWREGGEDEKSFVFDSNVSVFFSVPFLPQ